jgi:RNA polymerase sigma-70 factor (ECF subfamily)
MGTATISGMLAGRGGVWAGRADRVSESRAQAVAVQRDSRPANAPVRISPAETASPVGFEPPSQGERAAMTPERAAVIAEQKAMAMLAARCVAGDGAAWEELARTQHRRIYGICYRFIGSASEAEDLTQDVFIKVFRNIDSFDPTKGGFNTWLTTLTRNMLVDNYRRARMDRVTDSLDETVSGEEDGPSKLDRLADTGRNQEQLVSGMELRAQIQEALKQVSPELREAVILRDLEDMDYKDIADVLGVPQGTVKSRISRGRSELAKLLKRIEGQVM